MAMGDPVAAVVAAVPRFATPWSQRPDPDLPPQGEDPSESAPSTPSAPSGNTDGPDHLARPSSMTPDPLETDGWEGGPGDVPPDLDVLSTDSPPTRTRTSATGDSPRATHPQVTRAIAGLLGIVASLAAGLIRRGGRELRTPTAEERHDIAAPLARIGLRHADALTLAPDLFDAIEAAAATGTYAIDGGPLLIRPGHQPTEETP